VLDNFSRASLTQLLPTGPESHSVALCICGGVVDVPHALAALPRVCSPPSLRLTGGYAVVELSYVDVPEEEHAHGGWRVTTIDYRKLPSGRGAAQMQSQRKLHTPVKYYSRPKG
jgi:hypothetical protein